MSEALPRGTVTFLFTDIEGSTRLWQEFPEAMASSHLRHDAILRSAIDANDGRVVQVVGDSYKVAFHRADDALKAVLEAQRHLQGESWGETGELRVRMGLNTGPAVPAADGSGDYFEGYATIATAKRVMTAAHGGQVLLTQTTRDLLREVLADELTLRDLGEHRLKSLRDPLHLYQLEATGLRQDFPPIESLDRFPNNLPRQLTSFIGREEETAEVRRLLQEGRLVTLTGPGGTGKTRLSLEVAESMLDAFRHGVWFIELAPLTEPSQVMPELARNFGLKEQPYSTLDELVVDYLREKRALLILDNCEHLIEACARIAYDLLQQSKELTILASSREALGIAGEVVFGIPPLRAEESKQLFLDRALSANARLALTSHSEAAVARIGSRLDGIPLAIELAAARVSLFSPEQILERLDDRFRLLTGGSRTALPRQQTLRALIDWSYDMLSPEEAGLLRRLSVFAGGWTLEAVEAICSGLDALTLLTQLVHKSLVITQHQRNGSRYDLLETIRQYAHEKLVEIGEAAEARGSHASYFSHLAETAEPYLVTSQASQWIELLGAEQDNLRATHEWLVEHDVDGALKMGSGLELFWGSGGNQAEGRTWSEAAVKRAEMSASLSEESALARKGLIARALGSQVLMAVIQGDNASALEISRRCAALARELGDQRLLAHALYTTASGLLVTGDTTGVEEMVDEAVAAARASEDEFALGMALGTAAVMLMILDKDQEKMREFTSDGIALLESSGNKWGLSILLMNIGMMARYRGRFDEARARFVALEPLLEALGDYHRLNLVRSEYGHMERYEGQLQNAERIYRESIVEWQRIGHRAAVAHQLESFAFIAIGRERYERAARLLGAAETLREKVGIEMSRSEHQEYGIELEKLRDALQTDIFRSNWNQGRSMSTDEAVDFAREQDDHSPKIS